MLGNAVDSFSKLDKTTQQALRIAGGGAALAGGAYGAFNLGKALLGFGGGAAALTGSATALTASAAALDAAALKLAGSSVGAGVGAGASAAAGGAAAGGVSVGLGGAAVLGGAVAGGALDMMTPGTNAGITSLITGGESSLEQTNRALAAEAAARKAMQGKFGGAGLGDRAMTMPGAPEGQKFTTTAPISRGVIGDFLLGKKNEAITLPTAPSTPKVDMSQIDEAKRKADELNAHPILPKGDAAGLVPLMTGLEGLKSKGAELDAMTIKPNVDASGVGTIIQQLQTAIGLVQTLGSGIDGAKAKAASMPSPNLGGGTRTGSVASARSGAMTDRGMG